MVHKLYEVGVCLADGQNGPEAPHVSAQNAHQNCEGE